MSDVNLPELILQELRDMRGEQVEQGKTLVRNTVTLEEHVKRTNLLEKRMEHVDNEVDGLKTHIAKINTVFDLLKPTKEKMKWIFIVASIIGGTWGTVDVASDDGKIRQVIQKIVE